MGAACSECGAKDSCACHASSRAATSSHPQMLNQGKQQQLPSLFGGEQALKGGEKVTRDGRSREQGRPFQGTRMFFVETNCTNQTPARTQNNVASCSCTPYATFRPLGSNEQAVQSSSQERCNLKPAAEARLHASLAFGHGDRNVHNRGAGGATRSGTAGGSHGPFHDSLARPVQTTLIDGVHSFYDSGFSSPNNLLRKTTPAGPHLCEEITRPEKKITLHKWHLVSCDGGHTSEVAVGGFLTSELLEKDRRKTAPVVERLEKCKIKTEDGFEVKLIGLIDEHATHLNGFSFQMVHHFLSGFPYIWMHLLEGWSAEKLRRSKCADFANYCFNETIPIETQDAQKQVKCTEKIAAVEGTLIPPSFDSNPGMKAEVKANSAVEEEVVFDKSKPTMEEKSAQEQDAETGGGLIDVNDELGKECPLPCLISESLFTRNDRPVRGKRKRRSNMPTKQVATSQPSTSSKDNLTLQGKRKRQSNIPTKQVATSQPSTSSKDITKEVGIKPMVVGEDLMEADAKEGGFATTNGSRKKLHKPVHYEKQRRASRSSILPPPLPIPRVHVSTRLISEAFGLKTSRYGRLIVPPLAFWRSQTLAHDMDGGIIAVMNGSEEPKKVDTGRFNFSPPNKSQAIKLQRRLCAAATDSLTHKKLSTGKKKS